MGSVVSRILTGGKASNRLLEVLKEPSTYEVSIMPSLNFESVGKL